MLRGICRYCLTAAWWSGRRRNGTWCENICAVCGGIKHRGRFLSTRSCILFRRLPVQSLNLASPSQSFDRKGRKIPEMMKWHRNRDRGASEELVTMLLRFYLRRFNPICPPRTLHKRSADIYEDCYWSGWATNPISPSWRESSAECWLQVQWVDTHYDCWADRSV